MKTKKNRIIAAMLSMLFLTVAFILFVPVNASAQILKPGEIIYSRLPTDINAPPRDANSPTIWAVGQDGSNDRQITTGTQPRISDDGRFLLFKRLTRHPTSFNPFGGYADIFVRELSTGQETLIFGLNFEQGSVGYNFSPESNQGANEIILDNDCFMYKSNRDGSNLFQFPWGSAPYCLDDFPVVRRGGDQLIAFHNLTNDVTSGGLYTVGIGGANRQKIANTSCGDFDPAWSNDSQLIAYGSLFEACSQNFPQVAYPYFVSNIFKIKPDGSNKQQLTNLTNTNCRQPNSNCLTFGMVWTEDNSKIIAAGRINGTKGLFAFNANGSGSFTQIQISHGNAPDFVGGIVQPRVERQVLTFGGGVSESDNYKLVSSIGEPIAGQTSIGGSYNLESGFWAIPANNNRTPFDFDGDSKTDISIFRPSVGEWWYQQSSDNNVRVFTFGISSDKIAPADYDVDGKTDVAFFRPSTGEWFVLRSSNLTFFAAPFGLSTDIPAPGDFDGDGKTDFAVFRPSQGTWYINKTTTGVEITPFGTNGDIPAVADYDGDSKADIAIYRPTGGSGNGEWWILRSSNGSIFATPFGSATDKPVQADYTGDGKADIAFFRPSTGNWFVLRSEDLSYFAAPFGANGDVTAQGDYDGDGKTDFAVFRPSNVTWFVLKSSGGTFIQQFGSSGDIPVPSAFVP